MVPWQGVGSETGMGEIGDRGLDLDNVCQGTGRAGQVEPAESGQASLLGHSLVKPRLVQVHCVAEVALPLPRVTTSSFPSSFPSLPPTLTKNTFRRF